MSHLMLHSTLGAHGLELRDNIYACKPPPAPPGLSCPLKSPVLAPPRGWAPWTVNSKEEYVEGLTWVPAPRISRARATTALGMPAFAAAASARLVPATSHSIARAQEREMYSTGREQKFTCGARQGSPAIRHVRARGGAREGEGVLASRVARVCERNGCAIGGRLEWSGCKGVEVGGEARRSALPAAPTKSLNEGAPPSHAMAAHQTGKG